MLCDCSAKHFSLDIYYSKLMPLVRYKLDLADSLTSLKNSWCINQPVRLIFRQAGEC